MRYPGQFKDHANFFCRMCHGTGTWDQEGNTCDCVLEGLTGKLADLEAEVAILREKIAAMQEDKV